MEFILNKQIEDLYLKSELLKNLEIFLIINYDYPSLDVFQTVK